MRTIPVSRCIHPHHNVSTSDDVTTLLHQAEEPFKSAEIIASAKMIEETRFPLPNPMFTSSWLLSFPVSPPTSLLSFENSAISLESAKETADLRLVAFGFELSDFILEPRSPLAPEPKFLHPVLFGSHFPISYIQELSQVAALLFLMFTGISSFAIFFDILNNFIS